MTVAEVRRFKARSKTGRNRRARAALALSALLALAACGGGGDEDTAGDPPDPGAPAANPGGSGTLGSWYVSSFAAYEARAAWLRDSVSRFLVQRGNVTLADHPQQPGNQAGSVLSYPLASARVDYAQAAGLTGAGQTISIVDAGFRYGHEAISRPGNSSTGTVQSGPDPDHGTAVASIAAGDSATMVGVAPGAALHLGSWDWEDIAAATDQARALGSVAQNNSWGFPGAYADSTSFDFYFDNPALPEGSAYLAALDAYAAEGVVVFALSNEPSETRAGLMDGLPLLRPTLEPGWLAVGNAVAEMSGGDITSVRLVSAPCNESAPWCLVADGFWVFATADSTTSYGSGTGSSFAAPQVSGGLALLAEAFPGLEPYQLRLRLLASANNDFPGFVASGAIDLQDGPGTYLHDYSNLFGHGFLDLRAALLPIGPVVAALADGRTARVDTLGFSTGAAMGDAVSRSLAKMDFAVSDSFAGQFRMRGDGLVAGTAPRPLGATLLARASAAPESAMRKGSFADHGGISLAFAGTGAGFDGELLLPPPESGARTYGLALTRPLLRGPLQLDLSLKFARDDGSLMGFGGAEGGADMLGAGLRLSRDFENGAFFGLGAEIGVAALDRPAAFASVSRVGYDSFSASFGQRDLFRRGDRISLGVSLPVAVTSGSARVALPVLAEDGRTLLAAAPIALAPEERQVDLALGYSVPLGPRSDLGIVLQYSENYGNRAGERDTGAALSWTVRF